jgi:hypothetical protein
MAERQPGSDRGRAVIDWEEAFAFYVGLPAQRRTYAAVAVEFEVSVRTVERHGQTGRWAERLRDIDAVAARETDARLGQERAEQVEKLRKLIDATFIAYADNLRRGTVRTGPGDLDRLYKLWRQLDQELEHPPPPPEHAAAPARSAEHSAAVLAALQEAGALEALGLRLARPEKP